MRQIFVTMFIFTFLAVQVQAEELLVVQSLRSKMYQEVVSEAQKECSTTKTINISLDEIAEVDVPRKIRETRAKAVLAVGDKAFRAAIGQRRIPVIGVLTLESDVLPVNAITISYLADPAKYLTAFLSMGKKNVAIVYDGKLNAYVRRADRLARSMGITLVKREIRNPKRVSAALESLQNERIDSIWIIPDTNVVRTETVEPLMRFASAKNIPAIVFSKAYLKTGATLAIEPDRSAFGRLAGRMVCQSIESGVVPKNTFLASANFSQCGNEVLARRLGISASIFESTCNN